MKKLFTLSLSLLLCFAAFGCNSGNDNNGLPTGWVEVQRVDYTAQGAKLFAVSEAITETTEMQRISYEEYLQAHQSMKIFIEYLKETIDINKSNIAPKFDSGDVLYLTESYYNYKLIVTGLKLKYIKVKIGKNRLQINDDGKIIEIDDEDGQVIKESDSNGNLLSVTTDFYKVTFFVSES